MPEVEITSPSLSPSTLAGATEAATLIAESNETPTSPTVTALAEDTRRDRREGAMEEQAADRILGGSTGAREIGGEMAAKGEGLVILEEAVDDGAVVNTVGTLIVTELEAFDLPETESHGGLLGYDHQDLYLSMGLQRAHGREQESTTRPQEGMDGTVTWGGEKISIKCSNADDTVTAEVWNENPGSDVIIGKATMTKRHMRALALLQEPYARIRLPLSRERAGGRVETRGVLVARVRLVLDADVPRSTAAPSTGESLAAWSQNSIKAARRENEPIAQSEATGFLVCSGLTAYDLPSTEGLHFGGSQDPYVKITLGSTAERSNSVAGGGKLCDWTSQPLRWRVDPNHEEHHVWGQELVVEVWNDNQSRTDALIGRGFVRPETLRQVQRHTAQGGVSCRVKLSRQGEGRKATVGMVVSFEPDQVGAAGASKEESVSEEKCALRQPQEQLRTVLIKDLTAKDLGDIMSFGFGALDNVELYLVARAGAIERATPAAAVVSGKLAWVDTYLPLPLAEKGPNLPSLLRLELWTLSPVQDDQVGYVQADLSDLTFLPCGQNDAQGVDTGSTTSDVQSSLELPLCLVDTTGKKFKDVRPGVLSCTVELQSKTQGSDRWIGASEEPQDSQTTSTSPPRDGIIKLPTIGSTEGPGIVKVKVLDITLLEEAEAPEIRLALLPGKRFAITSPLLGVGGDASHRDGPETSVTSVCHQELELPCYSMDFDAVGAAVTLKVDVIVAGVLMGQRVLGQGRVDISEAIRSREEREISLDITSHKRGGAPFVVGGVSLSLRFADAWLSPSNSHLPSSKRSDTARSSVACLHSPGILRVFVVETRELLGLKPHQDPYMVVERRTADPTIACQAKPFSSTVATISEGRNTLWLESCDLRVGQAEADFLRDQPRGGSISFTVTLTDRDVRGGDELISSLEVVVTPESLAERESSVLWHRLFSQGRDRGFVRLGCCWIPADLEPVNVRGLRPEERVQTGTLYLWLKEGRDLTNPSPTAQRVRGLPPTCELELRPYAKVGRKKARDVLGCARVPEPDNPDLDTGVFHKFLKMDFAEAARSEDRDLAEVSPSLIVSVYTKLGEKKIVSGRAEVLLASLCGYKNLNGEAVLRLPRYHGDTGHGVLRGPGKERRVAFDEEDVFSCPVAAVDKAIPLLEDGNSSHDGSNGEAGGLRSGGRGGELRLRALYVPDGLADALGVRSAIKTLSRAAEASLQSFTQYPQLVLSRASDDRVEEAVAHDSEGQVLDVDTTALPGALEVYLIRATDMVQIEGWVDSVVQLRLLCSVGGELCISEMGQGSGTGVEWNHQFSLLVDDANVEMLEVLIRDGHNPQGFQKPIARCKIPLLRYAQSYHAMQTLDIGQVTPERFKLTDHRGRGFRGNIIVSINFLPEVVDQAHILREAFAPTTNLSPLHIPMKTTPRQVATATYDAVARAMHTICVLVVCMDGGDVSREDRVRVRVSLAGDPDDWRENEQFSRATNPSAVSGVGVVDEEAAVCRWHVPGGSTRELSGEDFSQAAPRGELLTLPWDPNLALSAWRRGRTPVLKFEISRGSGRPAQWTGFVPTTGLVHSPRSVFERAIPLTGRVGSEPPTSDRTAASAKSRDGRPGVSLEVAMVLQPAFLGGPGLDLDATISGRRQPAAKARASTSYSGSAQSPFHPDLRRIPPEAGELVVHCLRARNLRLPRNVQLSPKVVLTAVPDGEEVETSTPTRGSGDRHPVWGQTRTVSIADAVTARVIVRVRNTNQLKGDNVVGEVELSVAGMVAAEHGVAAAVIPRTSYPEVQTLSDGSPASSSLTGQKHNGAASGEARNTTRCTDTGKAADAELPQNSRAEPVVTAKRDKSKLCGVEAWFPLFVPGRQGGSRERERVGEVRLACRFLSTDFMLQRELTAGADDGDNGPIGVLRYKLEHRPGRLFVTIRCCRALPKAMIGERAPVVEARLRHGGWKSSTKRQVGLNPTFNESMVVEVLWTPQDLKSPELILEVKDKALGGGLLATLRLAIAPFILHPAMPAEIWCPLRPADTKAGIYCGLVYIPSPGGEQPTVPCPAMKSVESIADPELSGVSRHPWCGMVHVHVLSARGLPASSKDPQVGVRLRVGDGPLPPFQRTAVVRGGGGEPRFNSTFLLGLRQGALGLEDQAKRVLPGRTPVLEVEARCSRGRGNVMGTVEIPMFPLWFQGHMTRVWYPMRSSDGQWEAGRIFLGLQFIADGGGVGSSGSTAGSAEKAVGRRRYLFLEVRQGRDLRFVHASFGHPAVHLEMLGSGSRGKTSPANYGTTDPKWPDGAGCLALPYPTRGVAVGGPGGVSEVLRITVLSQRDDNGDGQEDSSGDRVIGQCDWPLPAQELELGRPISSWHALWEGGTPAGAVYVRCRIGYEGEALDHPLPYELQNDASEENSAASPLALGNYHVEFLKVRGFDRTLRRMGLACDNSVGARAQQGNGLQWNGIAYLVEAPGSGGEGCNGAASVPVASGRAVAVGARSRDASRPLCVQVSLASESLSNDQVDGTVKTLKAASFVPQEKLVTIVTVPGSELLEWFPAVDVKDESDSARPEAGEADTGQVLLSIRYAPLAVGVLDVTMREAQLACNQSPPGSIKVLTRILPAQTGGAIGHKVRSTPEGRGVRINLRADRRDSTDTSWDTVYSWEDACPHRMRFNNAFNKQPATLHVCVVQSDRMLGFASVGVEAIVHDVMTTMAREISEGSRAPRGNAQNLGPVGLREGDFGDPVQAWYPLKTSTEAGKESSGTSELDPPPSPLSSSTEVGRVHIEIKFAPHPKVLVKNWQEGAAVTRATGIAAMKAIFYRLNRSGSLVVDTEDLRLALVDAVESFLTKPAKDAKNESRAHHVGEFVLLMLHGMRSNLGTGKNAALSESAAESILTVMDRDRVAEVTFTEFCTFLSQAAAWQAEAAVGDLMIELAEDNDDEQCDNDNEDDVWRDDDGERSAPLEKHDIRDVGQIIGCAKDEAAPLAPTLQHRQPRPISAVHKNDRPTGRRLSDRSGTTPTKRKLSAHGPSRDQASARDPTLEPPEEGNTTNVALVQEEPATTRDAYVGTDRPAPRQAAQKERTALAGRQTPRPEDVTSWTVGEVLHWLSEDMQLPKHAHSFREASVDGLVLCDLTDALLKEGLGVLNPLHRLKILRHVQKLYKTQQPDQIHPREGILRTSPISPNHGHPAQGHLSRRPRSNGVVGVAETRRHMSTGGVSVDDSQTRKPHPPVPPILLVEEEAFGRPPFQALQGDVGLNREIEKEVRGPDSSGEDHELPVGPEAGLTADEAAFAGRINNVGEELVPDGRLGQEETAPSPSKKRRRHLPANATREEVHDVVQAAMWEAAALLEEQVPAGSGAHGQAMSIDEFPPAWWGSSDGGSTIKSDTFNSSSSDAQQVLLDDRNGRRYSKHGGQTEAQLLFDKLCSHQLGAAKSPHNTDGALKKLTRYRLEVGIRTLLQIDMRWEQWQLFLESIATLRTRGYLNLAEFAKTFAFQSITGRSTTPRSLPHPDDQAETTPGLAELDSGLLDETMPRTGWAATTDVVELQRFVLDIAGALRTGRTTVRAAVSASDRRADGKVSVSEFMSLVKALAGRRRYSASARVWVGGFDKKQAYRLLRCVDKDGDRRVALRDLVAFVFVTWTEELTRLARAGGEHEEVRQRRRQLQKDLRRHFPAKFRRTMNLDEINPETVHHGPFSALLTRLGLNAPSPPSPRSQPSFASPLRGHRESFTTRSGSSNDNTSFEAKRSLCTDSAENEAQRGGRNRRARSIQPPRRPHRANRPATLGERGRQRFTVTADRKTLGRCSRSEHRVLSLPPRADLSATTLTAAHNRELLAQGTFQTCGGERFEQSSS